MGCTAINCTRAACSRFLSSCCCSTCPVLLYGTWYHPTVYIVPSADTVALFTHICGTDRRRQPLVVPLRGRAHVFPETGWQDRKVFTDFAPRHLSASSVSGNFPPRVTVIAEHTCCRGWRAGSNTCRIIILIAMRFRKIGKVRQVGP